jgi:hypothetical protein
MEEEGKLKAMYQVLADSASNTQEKFVLQLLATKIAQVK